MCRINRAIAIIIKPREIGRVKKMVRLPYDTMSDCRNAFSRIRHKTSAKTKGAASYSNFFHQVSKNSKKGHNTNFLEIIV